MSMKSGRNRLVLAVAITTLALTSVVLSATRVADQAPQLNPAVQRAEMIRLLQSIDARLTTIQTTLERAHPKPQESK
jgi:hypothetical protein